jgi:hypothetical protein
MHSRAAGDLPGGTRTVSVTRPIYVGFHSPKGYPSL